MRFIVIILLALSTQTLCQGPSMMGDEIPTPGSTISRPMWDITYNQTDLNLALRHGFDILDHFKNISFSEHAHQDRILHLVRLSRTLETQAPELSLHAKQLAHDLAIQWRQYMTTVTLDPTAEDFPESLSLLLCDLYASHMANVAHPQLIQQLQSLLQPMNSTQIFGFDPLHEHPTDVAGDSVATSPFGATIVRSRWAFFSDALMIAYVCEQMNVSIPVTYIDILAHLDDLKPYVGVIQFEHFVSQLNAIEHILYTLNDFGIHTLASAWLPQEFAFLENALVVAVEHLQNPGVVGELLDVILCFQPIDPQSVHLRKSVQFLLDTQASDGSWDDFNDPEDVYRYFQVTLQAMLGLRHPTPQTPPSELTPAISSLLHDLTHNATQKQQQRQQPQPGAGMFHMPQPPMMNFDHLDPNTQPQSPPPMPDVDIESIIHSALASTVDLSGTQPSAPTTQDENAQNHQLESYLHDALVGAMQAQNAKHTPGKNFNPSSPLQYAEENYNVNLEN